jgi:hypothetical protein
MVGLCVCGVAAARQALAERHGSAVGLERAMNMNPHHYAHEKIGAAIAWLLLPGVDFEKRLAGAMAELCIAFYVTSPPASAGKLVETIKETVGAGLWQERVRTLTPAERSEVVTAFWELDRAVSREYYTYEARRPAVHRDVAEPAIRTGWRRR